MIQTLIDRPHHIAFIERPVPVPPPGEVLVQVSATGICATDVHSYLGETIHGNTFPFHPGHEIAGVVSACGEGVVGFEKGDRVVVSPLTYCGICENCLDGQWNFCTDIRAIGLVGPGGFSDYVVSAERNLVRYQNSTDIQISLAEPLATVLHALSLVKIRPDRLMLIQGAGTLGLLFLKVLKNYFHCSRVQVSDTLPERLACAQANGGLPTSPETLADVRKVYDLIIDCTGNAQAVQNTLPMLRNGGQLVIFGVCKHDATISVSPFEVYRRQLSVIGSFALNNNIRDAVDMIESKTIEVDDLVSGVVGRDQLVATLEGLAARELVGKYVVALSEMDSGR